MNALSLAAPDRHNLGGAVPVFGDDLGGSCHASLEHPERHDKHPVTAGNVHDAIPNLVVGHCIDIGAGNGSRHKQRLRDSNNAVRAQRIATASRESLIPINRAGAA